MAKWANTKIMDKGLEYLRDHTTHLVACQGQPSDYLGAITDLPTGHYLGKISLGLNHFQLQAGLVSGRRLTILGRSSLLTTQTGMADHFALVDQSNGELLYVTTVANAQQTYAQNTIDTPDWDITISAPV